MEPFPIPHSRAEDLFQTKRSDRDLETYRSRFRSSHRDFQEEHHRLAGAEECPDRIEEKKMVLSIR